MMTGLTLFLVGSLVFTISFAEVRQRVAVLRELLDEFFTEASDTDRDLLMRTRFVSAGAAFLGIIWIVLTATAS